jgi:pimeloyl-ACP methyl ester carboxylesterase
VYAIDFILEPNKSNLTGKINSKNDIIDWYSEVFNQLKLEQFSIIGASKGGWLATYIAITNPKKINKLILLSPAQTFSWFEFSSDLLQNIGYTLNPKREKLREALQTMSYNVDGIDQLYIDQYYILSKNAGVDKTLLKMMPISNRKLGKLTMPVLVLVGDRDIMNDQKSLDEARKTIPTVTTEMIKNAGHFLSIDQAKVVNQKMLDFLK